MTHRCSVSPWEDCCSKRLRKQAREEPGQVRKGSFMRTRTVVLSCLIGAVVLFLGYEYSAAQSKPGGSDSGIGIVSVRAVFRDCKVNATYRDRAIAEQSTRNAELDALQKAVEAQEAGLRALKPGSTDYLTQYEELLKKQAELDAKKQFNSQQRVMKDRRWTEDLYKEVLRITKELAEKKGLTLVLEAEEPEFPMANADELMMALQTHKVLFSKGCVDLTAEVTAEMDKIASKFKM